VVKAAKSFSGQTKHCLRSPMNQSPIRFAPRNLTLASSFPSPSPTYGSAAHQGGTRARIPSLPRRRRARDLPIGTRRAGDFPIGTRRPVVGCSAAASSTPAAHGGLPRRRAPQASPHPQRLLHRRRRPFHRAPRAGKLKPAS